MMPQPERNARHGANRLRRRLLLALVALAAVALGGAPLAAQYPGGAGRPGGGGMGGGHHGGGRMGGNRGGAALTMPTDQELAGPLAPAALKGVLSLSDEQVERYQPLWKQHMSATKPQRDSAQVALAALHRAFGDHDRTAMRQYAPLIHSLAPALEDRDKHFADKELKPILTKDQAKSFDKWRDEQKRLADDERRQYGRS